MVTDLIEPVNEIIDESLTMLRTLEGVPSARVVAHNNVRGLDKVWIKFVELIGVVVVFLPSSRESIEEAATTSCRFRDMNRNLLLVTEACSEEIGSFLVLRLTRNESPEISKIFPGWMFRREESL